MGESTRARDGANDGMRDGGDDGRGLDRAETTARAWADHVLKDCTTKEDAVAAGAKETWLSGWRVK